MKSHLDPLLHHSLVQGLVLLYSQAIERYRMLVQAKQHIVASILQGLVHSVKINR